MMPQRQPKVIANAGDIVTLSGEVVVVPKGWKVYQLPMPKPPAQYGDFRDEIVKEINRSMGVPASLHPLLAPADSDPPPWEH
ncbi:phage portal protein [Allorhodopirellula heiligendammensis]|uniref:Uncharacterized protein n=1 Tax=Allorhodopirellula heiligendammensis TaxID=2714739 RepID=A0A5C6C0D8_9BACT|nr:phage portal protein [Allorhodopirellula heiligendammensis]TWU18000.1 hypothetical protein Poly21_01530 [Allorhodopirellula heiligendammensis]